MSVHPLVERKAPPPPEFSGLSLQVCPLKVMGRPTPGAQDTAWAFRESLQNELQQISHAFKGAALFVRACDVSRCPSYHQRIESKKAAKTPHRPTRAAPGMQRGGRHGTGLPPHQEWASPGQGPVLAPCASETQGPPGKAAGREQGPWAGGLC